MCKTPISNFLTQLKQGHQQFLRDELPNHLALFQRLSAEGQNPRAAVVACSDSRIHPNMITQSSPGELFIIRNVANLVPPHDPDGGYHGTSAALEYAVRVLNVEAIIILGHSCCGGVRALSQDCCEKVGADGSDFIGKWMEIAWNDAHVQQLALTAAKTGQHRPLEERMVTLSIHNLRGFPFIHQRETAGTLELIGLYFNIAEGRLYRYEPSIDAFEPL
ncbi:Carbonate dehydratase [Magnetococcus marinus MC-1]|uniref:Carbonic anhydrase n=1 Tax=Magnetococcus marinus (strain ATCC BAA-1437 / JCM 17883 / MC-1) TaxID=156889 RepID=A0LAJ8_MAGMM|nr:carbonic anhydrase [Magnetococcus marinus]ABK44991.1 Carbonate dehydratase [Magnetococcus marinus MC-1]